MKKAILIMVGFVLMLMLKAYAYDDGDFQVWNTEAQEFKVNNDSKIAFEEEFRWGDDADEFYYHHYDAGFFYSIKKYLNIGCGYRHVYELKRGKFKPEKEPYLTAALSWDLEGFKIEDRSRMEYRYFDYQADSWRYRNRFTVKLPWKFIRMEIQPYVSDEVFVGFGGANQLNQNRLYSGIGINICKNVKGELYYMLQESKSAGKWVDANILGTKIKIAF